MATDPSTLPKLTDWNAEKLTGALILQGFQPSGVQCPASVTELLDVKGTEGSAVTKAGIKLPTIHVICPVCGWEGERYT